MQYSYSYEICSGRVTADEVSFTVQLSRSAKDRDFDTSEVSEYVLIYTTSTKSIRS